MNKVGSLGTSVIDKPRFAPTVGILQLCDTVSNVTNLDFLLKECGEDDS